MGGQNLEMPDDRNEYLQRVAQFVEGIVDGRDPDLAAHQSSVEKLAAALGKAIGCSREDIRILSIGAQLHDIGKMSLSENILHKPGRLTTSEYSLVKQHSELGHQLLSPLSLDPRIPNIVRFHHENYDGTGYPSGLSKTDIPIFARIIRIVDSFDALTKDRPYHLGLPKDKVLQLLQNDSRLYDPDILEAFCRTASNGRRPKE